MNAINQIINQLNEVFVAVDAKVLTQTQEWAKARVAAVKEFKASDEAQSLRKNQHEYYTRLFALAGGKTWYTIFDGRSSDTIEAIIVDHCAKVAYARDAKIAAKLAKANVTSVESSSFAHTSDGFTGVFIVDTDAGKKRVSIDAIYAGGYHIQCLHQRILVKIK